MEAGRVPDLRKLLLSLFFLRYPLYQLFLPSRVTHL
jgi:hypothetical protein